MDTKTRETLDSLLTKHFDNRPNSSTPSERESALNLFHKKCKKFNIDGESYIRNSPLNPSRQKSQQNTKYTKPNNNTSYKNNKDNAYRESSRYNGKSNYSRTYREQFNESDFDDFTEFMEYIFRTTRKTEPPKYTNYQAEYERKEQEKQAREAHEKRQREEQERRNKWEQENTNYFFFIKDVMFEGTLDSRSQRVIKINALARRSDQTRYPLMNFVLYSPDFNPIQWFTKDAKFKVETGRVYYYHNHLVVKRIWIIDERGVEKEIHFERSSNYS